MRSDVVVVATPGRLPRIECRGGVAARHTETDTVHLVSAAATPLGGDVIAIRLVVEPGARLRLRSAAASVVLPGPGTRTSHSCWTIEVAGELDVDLEPTIVAADARHLSEVRVQLAEAAQLRIRERVQIGRTDQRGCLFPWPPALNRHVKFPAHMDGTSPERKMSVSLLRPFLRYKARLAVCVLGQRRRPHDQKRYVQQVLFHTILPDKFRQGTHRGKGADAHFLCFDLYTVILLKHKDEFQNVNRVDPQIPSYKLVIVADIRWSDIQQGQGIDDLDFHFLNKCFHVFYLFQLE